jgi:hypothetical protein
MSRSQDIEVGSIGSKVIQRSWVDILKPNWSNTSRKAFVFVDSLE